MSGALTIFLALLLSSSQVPATARDPIVCRGIWAPDSSETSLRRHFGTANVRWEPIEVGEGEREEGTVVFPRDPQRRIEVFWKDASARRRPSRVVLNEGSNWATFSGIRAGTSLKQIEQMNSRPFTLAGFGWDYGGTVTDWREGRLATIGGDACDLMVRLDPALERLTTAQRQAYDKVTGDRDFPSSQAEMQLLNPRVYQILITYR